MSEPDGDPRRIEVWKSMAEHFLDTETRHEIPQTALRCLQADLTIEEAQNVWCYEVSSVLAINLWSVAGEWAGWDEAWLIGAIRRARKSWYNRPGPIQWLLYRFAVHFNHDVWLAIERCMQVLLEAPSRAERDQLASDLEVLARHWFDFAVGDPSAIDDLTRARLERLYPEPLYSIVKPATLWRQRSTADLLVRNFLRWRV